MARLGRKEPGVGAQVEFGVVIAALDDQARETWTHLDTSHEEPCFLQRALDRGQKHVDGGRRHPKEVEVSRLALNVTARDQRGAAGQREVLRLGEAGDDRGDMLL